MRTDLLLEHFHEVVKTPEDVAQVEAAILQLAVQGKLVPQDPNDEPVQLLVPNRNTHRQELVQREAVRRRIALEPVDPAEMPYPLPRTWLWTRLGEISNYGKSGKTGMNGLPDSAWVLDLEDIEKCTSRLLQRVQLKERPFKSAKSVFQAGDVLYCAFGFLRGIGP